jgi:cobalt-zinc-cadmium efflux system membrane fusion protein
MNTQIKHSFIFMLVIILIAGCQGERIQGATESAADEPAVTETRDPATIFLLPEMRQWIKVGKPFNANIADKLNVPGQIKVHEQKLVRVGASITGRIVEVFVQLGDNVEAGTKLARIASPELTQAQLSYLRAHSLAMLAERAAERAKQLFAGDVISAAELQRRESELQVSRAELSAAKDQLRLLGMDNGAMNDLIKRGQILPSVAIAAPRSGTIIERNVALGQVVQPSDQLFTLADLSVVWVVGDVPEYTADLVNQGQNVEIRVPALGNISLEGVIIFVADVVNPLTRTVKVRTEVSNAERRLKPDMLATVHIAEHPRQHLVIPEDAVVREDNRDHVFIVRGDNRFTLVPVELGEKINQLRPVYAGLNPDQLIVVDGAFHLNNERKRADLE